MNRSGKVILYQEFDHVNFYTILFDGESLTEFDKFVTDCQRNQKLKLDFDILMLALKRISKDKAYERKFRPEGAASAVPLEVCKLRLYCYRVCDEILVLGNGGLKTAGTAQECPNVYPHFINMNLIASKIRRKRREPNFIHGKQLPNNFHFTITIPEI